MIIIPYTCKYFEYDDTYNAETNEESEITLCHIRENCIILCEYCYDYWSSQKECDCKLLDFKNGKTS